MAFIGIDLGTTNSLAAVWREGKCELIPNSFGEFLTPSVISIDSGKVIIGKSAKDRLVSHPTQTIAQFKRLMGTSEKVSLGENIFTPEELSALLLKQLKADTERFLDNSIEEAVISVPAYFNDNQRTATKIAAQIAGLRVERLINEPTAAAIAYGIHEESQEKKFIVIDLGGGTFDVSVMEKFDDLLEVHASAGDSFLGGEDFSERLMHEICHKLDIDYDNLSPVDRARFYRIFDVAKKKLSNEEKTEIRFELPEKSHKFDLSRRDFFTMVEPLFKKLLAPIEKSIRDANIKVNDIEEVYLVGGATRMPAIRQFMTRVFGQFPSCHIDPDQTVVIGAAIQSALKQRNQDLQDIVLTDVCPFSMGIETANKSNSGKIVSGFYSVIIERNQTIPTSKVERYYTLQDNQTEIKVTVYQGEDRLAKNNIKLGELLVQVPKAKSGEESIDVRFTYDINGLLEVLVTVVSTQQNLNMVIQNSGSRLSQSEIEIALKKLESIKIHPRDQALNQALLSRAERLYRERLGEDRDHIGQVITNFEQCLNRQNKREITAAARELKLFLDSIDDDIWH